MSAMCFEAGVELNFVPGSGAATQFLAEGDAGFVPRLCMQIPAERAGPSGTCEDARGSYSACLATSTCGNGTCQNIFHEGVEK